MIHRRVAGWLLLSVLFLATAHAQGAAPLSPVISASSLGVMTFNMQHRDRPRELEAIAGSLRSDLKNLPDFILCQEVLFKRNKREADTAAVLAKHLGYHSRGTKRKSDREGVAIISRFPFAHYDELHLKANTSRLLLGFRRVSVMGEFAVPGVGRVRVVNVHFTNWGFERRIRSKQINETLAWIAKREAQAPAAVTFLGGDFNARPHWDEMEPVYNRFRSFNSEAPTKGAPGNAKHRIDYIFVAAGQPGLFFTEEQVLWKKGLVNGRGRFYPSDHLPVVHSYSLRPALAGRDAEPVRPSSLSLAGESAVR